MTTMTKSVPTFELRQAGQSPWLDSISRSLIDSGELNKFVDELGILGVTSNPAIFEKAINQPNSAYEYDIRQMVKQGKSTFEIYDALTQADIQRACDILLPIYKKSRGEHGFVSLEVAPGLAYYEDETVQEALRLFKAVNRKNLMIKVPATKQGVPAVKRLIAKGVNVNITLMFSNKHYIDVANAYIEGLEELHAAGGDVRKVHSVASVFVSRYDSLMDNKIEAMIKASDDSDHKELLQSLLHQGAIANSKLIYQSFKEIFGSQRFKSLQSRGAWIQKVLWGSTSAKNPALHDLYYVESLIGRETVNTMPQATLEAFLDHGTAQNNSIEHEIRTAKDIVEHLADEGFDLEAIGEGLQKAGAEQFCDAFHDLMQSIENHQPKDALASVSCNISKSVQNSDSINKKIKEFEAKKAKSRFFEKDPSLWKEDLDHQKVILNRLGWLDAPEWLLKQAYELDILAAQIKKEGVKDLVLLGMGGSSLGPEVISLICKGQRSSRPRFHVLDTTHPDSVLELREKIDLAKSLFIVASKSGTTVETTSQYRYFYDQYNKHYEKEEGLLVKSVGRHFIAITDKDSWLESEAFDKYFRRVFINPTDIGGRYSVLSFFGMVPTALMGISVRTLLRNAIQLYQHSEQAKVLQNNEAFSLGIALGQLAKEGSDKVYFWLSPKLRPFEAWLEQLIAESTGKEGVGIVPVIGETPQSVSHYPSSSVIVTMKLQGEKTASLDNKVQKLSEKGCYVYDFEWDSPMALGAEFLRWEIATSIAAAAMDINPFDEPNVKESKEITVKLLNKLKKTNKLASPKQVFSFQGQSLKLNDDLYGKEAVISLFKKSLQENGYIAILSYTPRTKETEKSLKQLQKVLSSTFKVPVLYGFGPRYLHSIGQLYKGGARIGLFLELFDDAKNDHPVPETHFSFSQLIKAQAFGDLEALKNKKITSYALHLKKDVLGTIQKFISVF